MHLKTLELQGFKSFPDKTVLTFDDGATVIVGPNGSGKSNITDAMRWVLGELSTKNIRGSKLEDVIFIGTEVRKPMSYAEVSVTFDNSSQEGRLNSPYDEITVTRRYYRAGKSEYLINRAPCRLTDIYQLFMNTGVGREGYSIIGQGRIAEIISKKSEDRRNIFEEAAGISKIRHEKNEAEKNLKQTQENMDRVEDLYRELERRVGPLERESEKAKKYFELYERKKVADVSLWIYDSQKTREQITKLSNDCKMSAHELEMANDSLQQIEAQENALAERFRQTKIEADRVYGEIRACNTTLSSLNADLAVMENNVKHAESISGNEILEIERLNAKKNVVEDEIAQKKQHAELIRQELSKVQDEYLAIRQEQADISKKRDEIVKEIDELFVQLKELEGERNQKLVRISVIENSSTNDKDRADAINENLGVYQAELDEMVLKTEDASKGLADYEANLSKLEKELAEAEAEIEEKTARYDELKEKMDSLKSQALALTERINVLNSMDELFEGYAKSVTYIMNAYQNNEIENAGIIYGPVSKLITVKDEHVIAIETALGVGLQHIVVDNEKTAKACIQSLKQSKSGRATFYPVSSVSPQSITVEMQNASSFKGYVGIANELISFDKKFENIFSSLLGRTLIFDNIDNATEMAKAQKYRVKVVTLDGQQINAGGSFTGGSAKHDSDILSRAANVKRMQEERDAFYAEIDKIKAEGQKLGECLRALTQKRAADKQQYNLIDVVYRNEKTEYETIVAQMEVKKSLVEGLLNDNQRLAEEEQRSVVELAELKKARLELDKQIEEISAKRQELDELKYDYSTNFDEYSEKMSDNLIRVTAINKDVEAADLAVQESQGKLDEILAEIEDRKAKMTRLSEDVSSFAEKNAENRKLYDEATQRLEAYEKEREKLFILEQQIEQKRNELNLKSKEIASKKEIIARSHGANEIKLEQLNIELEKMRDKLKLDYELEPSDALALGYPEVTEKNRKDVLAEVNECRQSIRALGSINTSAIEEYKEVKERYDFYQAQFTDLEKAKADVLAIIEKLETEMKEQFVTAFNAVNENFDQVFKELFGGGHAELILDNPEDVLNCGIEIKAAPPGKVIKSLMLLSGGEQSFVAIALLFAILKVNPTPFCIFDEIEAALDEVNVTRFGQYIKRYSHQTQFIVITHRRGTMEIADRLYGVTMPQKGISKVLTMDVDDVGKESILEAKNAK